MLKGFSETDLSLPWLLSAKSSTDANINACSQLEPSDSYVYSEKWLRETGATSQKTGTIRFSHLLFILANEDSYSVVLPMLERFFIA